MFAIIKSTKPNRFKGGIEMILAEKIVNLIMNINIVEYHIHQDL